MSSGRLQFSSDLLNTGAKRCEYAWGNMQPKAETQLLNIAFSLSTTSGYCGQPQ